ncbi:2OG-Fe(II) oxygenase family protein [Caulobacter segnis]|uniref:2OG-Fe(II) oxygenase n=1 Tax=Caulobacter segnis TaxID=88688 RepID=UPI002410AEDA|nr:2OG-Fe(II) oxygenase family protein [Caulobacter segnis]MDG2522665.1 2OG-Fe(II) oxygenase family protein [Caulobacter segnis]
MAAAFRLNPAIDWRPYAETYAREGVVQIPDILSRETAEAVAQILERGTPWRLALSNAQGTEEVLDQPTLARMPRETLTAKVQETVRRATENFAYVYLCYPMISGLLDGKEPTLPIHDVTEWLNSREFLDFGQNVIGRSDITKADAQASFYRQGDFLSLHDDTGQGERRAAYTLGFTRRWRPDWGGQLLFHDADGQIERGLTPGFNVLSIFKVPRAHSVAPVAAYAGAPRHSIVGWLRNDPPFKSA